MSRKKPFYARTFFLFLALLLFATPALTRQQKSEYGKPAVRYTVIDLGTDIRPMAINAAGDIVGTMDEKTAFLYHKGKMIPLPAPDGKESHALAINDLGQVLGFVGHVYAIEYACVWQNGALKKLWPERTVFGSGSGDFEGNAIQPLDINDHQQIIGSIPVIHGTRAFTWHLGVTEAPRTEHGAMELRFSPLAINHQGQILGSTFDDMGGGGTGPYPIVWENGKVRDLHLLDGKNGFDKATAFNDRGWIVGTGKVGEYQGPLLWDGKGLLALETPAYISDADHTLTDKGTRPKAVNNKGQIVGLAMAEEYRRVGNRHRYYYLSYPVLWENGCCFNLNDLIPSRLKINLEDVVGINDKGQIVVTGRIDEGKLYPPQHAFLLTPTTNK